VEQRFEMRMLGRRMADLYLEAMDVP
jgi:hypothetical protein